MFVARRFYLQFLEITCPHPEILLYKRVENL